MPKYGKPSGLTLRQHTDNVKQQGAMLRKQFPFWTNKYKQLTGEDLDDFCTTAEEYHDYGKGFSDRWREACAKDVALYHTWLRRHGFATEQVDRELHHRYEEELRRAGKATAPNLFCAGVRHEFSSLDFLAQHRPKTPGPVVAAIAAHHGKLAKGEYVEKRWRMDGTDGSGLEVGPYYKFYKQFRGSSNKAAERESFDKLVLRRYRYAAVRSLLQLADTRASRWEGMGDEGMVPLIPFTGPKGFGVDVNLRPVQDAAVKFAEAQRTILRAPTGSGKTYACLLWAERQILTQTPRADRLVIAMPTRFTSNALREAVREQIPDLIGGGTEGEDEPQVGLYHSSAFFNLYGDNGDDSWGSKEVERQKLARYLATPVTVCTIDHLLACLTGTREQHFSTFFFLANSCVVFDETDFYDEFVQANIQTLLDVLDILKVPTLIMSATVPNSARSLYRVKDLIRETAQPGSENVRKKMRYLGTSAKPEDTAEFLKEMLTAGQGIIYANTVARALSYYEFLEPLVGETPLTIYHSRFTEPDKKRIEEELEANLGKKAHADGRASGIVIMTQIGEMSINISSKLMLTDCCPWDRLAQRIGRLARFSVDNASEVNATVAVVEPIDDKGEAYAWPYVEVDTKSDTSKRTVYRPIAAYAKTLAEIKVLIEKADDYRLTPENLVEHTNRLYQNGMKFSEATIENQLYYRELIKDNWLLVGAAGNNDEDTKTNTWQSRNISDQLTVLIQAPESRFTNYNEFQKYALAHGVSCPVYKIRSELRKKDGEGPSIKLTTVLVGAKGREKSAEVYYACEGAYDKKMGLLSLYGYDWKANHLL
ncbi:CRISPR-associated helicase Cas3' [Neolewinella lacunae]|nr:CRISPR-associated helicase Cas3' [Neolewinella lacunae]MDN3634102.1 CRISPR-associated helicase Cas3' [Neolewinella lacunae]